MNTISGTSGAGITKLVAVGLVLVMMASSMGAVAGSVKNERTPVTIIDDEGIQHKVWYQNVNGFSEIYYANNRYKMNGQGNMGLGNDINPTKVMLSSDTIGTDSIEVTLNQTEEGWIYVTWIEKLPDENVFYELYSANSGLHWALLPPPYEWMRAGNYFEYQNDISIVDSNETFSQFTYQTKIIEVDMSASTITFNDSYQSSSHTHSHEIQYDIFSRMEQGSPFYAFTWVNTDEVRSGNLNLGSFTSAVTNPNVQLSPPTYETTTAIPNGSSKLYFAHSNNVLQKAFTLVYNETGVAISTISDLIEQGHDSMWQPPAPSTLEETGLTNSPTPQPQYAYQAYYPPYYSATGYKYTTTWGSASAYAAYSVSSSNGYMFIDSRASAGTPAGWGYSYEYTYQNGPSSGTFTLPQSGYATVGFKVRTTVVLSTYTTFNWISSYSYASSNVYVIGDIYQGSTLIAQKSVHLYDGKGFQSWSNQDTYVTGYTNLYMYKNTAYSFRVLITAENQAYTYGVGGAWASTWISSNLLAAIFYIP